MKSLLLKQPRLSGDLKHESYNAGSLDAAELQHICWTLGVIALPECTPGRQQVMQYVWLLLATTLISEKKN